MSDKTPPIKRKTKKSTRKDKYNRNGKYTSRGLRIKISQVKNAPIVENKKQHNK